MKWLRRQILILYRIQLLDAATWHQGFLSNHLSPITNLDKLLIFLIWICLDDRHANESLGQLRKRLSTFHSYNYITYNYQWSKQTVVKCAISVLLYTKIPSLRLCRNETSKLECMISRAQISEMTHRVTFFKFGIFLIVLRRNAVRTSTHFFPTSSSDSFSMYSASLPDSHPIEDRIPRI